MPRPLPRHRPARPLARGAALAAVALLAACSRSDDEAAPAPDPVLTPAAAPTASADGRTLTEGQWQIGENAAGASAMYGGAATEPLVTFQCESATGEVTLTLASAANEAKTYTIEVGDQAARVSMSPAGTELPIMRAAIDATQPIFAAFADPRESIEISAPGETALLLPGHSGLDRVLQACS